MMNSIMEIIKTIITVVMITGSLAYILKLAFIEYDKYYEKRNAKYEPMLMKLIESCGDGMGYIMSMLGKTMEADLNYNKEKESKKEDFEDDYNWKKE